MTAIVGGLQSADMPEALKGDSEKPPVFNKLWLDAIGAAFHTQRCERINQRGVLIFHVEEGVELLSVIFTFSQPERLLRLMFAESKRGAILTAWEGSRETERRPLIKPRMFKLKDDAELVASTYEKCTQLAAAFTDWARYPLFSRQIMLEWKNVADEQVY